MLSVNRSTRRSACFEKTPLREGVDKAGGPIELTIGAAVAAKRRSSEVLSTEYHSTRSKAGLERGARRRPRIEGRRVLK